MVDRLVGSKTLQRLRTQVLPAGLRDVQEWTGVTVTFRRRGDEDGVFVDVATMPVISMSSNGGQYFEAIGGVETTARSSMKLWLGDMDVVPIQPQDRFSHDGHVYVVEMVRPQRLDTYVVVEYTVLEN